ncbi:MAG: hypothetical protein RBS57_14135 [Desulforhabdus sp.]|jgi:hypothetical protein|nr:hypothetical protein [Desulforhabdus sp.]
MKFLLRPLMTACTLLLALLLWWRPAERLIEVKPVDWAKEYEKLHTPADQVLDTMGFYREIIRSSKAHLPLTEFIAEETEGELVQADSEAWRDWYSGHFSGDSNIHRGRLYFQPDAPPFAGLHKERGYIEIRAGGDVDFLFFATVPARYFSDLNIPPVLRYPFRKEAAAVLLAALALMALNRFYRGPSDPAAESTAGKGCKVFVAALAAGLALIALPFFYYDFEGYIPAFFIGFFVLLVGLVGLAMFGWQMHILRNILSGKDLLAHWRYDSEEWKRFVEWEFQEEKGEKTGLWLFISAIIVVVGLGFLLIMRDAAAAWVFLFMLGLIPLLWIIAVLLPRLTYRHNIKGPGEVYIGTAGLYMNGSVHTWRLLGSRFEAAEYREKPLPMLAILYSYLMVSGRSLFIFRQYVEVRVPVPAGEKEQGKIIAQTLQAKKNKQAEKQDAQASP